MVKKKIYIRVVEASKLGEDTTMNIYEWDLKELAQDKKYHKEYHPKNKVTYYTGLKKVK
jgi:hypothetical protein